MWWKEIPFVSLDTALAHLYDHQNWMLLESAKFEPSLGRYSYIGLDPFGVFKSCRGESYWNEERSNLSPLEALRKIFQKFYLSKDSALPPFQGGGIGYIAYEFGERLEPLRAVPSPRQDGGPQDIYFAFFDLILAWDHLEGKTLLIASGLPEITQQKRYQRAQERLKQADQIFERPPEMRREQGNLPALSWRESISQEGYVAQVERVKNYIAAGDIYQANIARHFEADLPKNFDLHLFYQKLRSHNPAPFGGYLHCGDCIIASSSPERFLKFTDNYIEIRPIKGTARRSVDPAEDAAVMEDLRNSEKDRAENIMIVDLLRNDLARVSQLHSVEVPVLCGLESYGAVHHLVSQVRGKVRPGIDVFHVIEASFPGGSITGVPKLRAREIIAEIEQRPRGIYCGAMGYINFNGDADLNIAIRTLTFSSATSPRTVSFQAGGGITLLSDPVAEYLETEVKAEKIFSAFT